MNLLKDFKTEIKTFFLVVLIAVVISFSGILLLKTMQLAPIVQAPQPAPSPQPQTPDKSDFTLSPSTPLGINSVEGWQTYRNEELGFEVKYPGIYDGECKPHVETTSTGESIVRIGPIHVSVEDSEGVTLSEYVDQVIRRYEKARDPSYSLESRTDTTLGDKKAIQVVITWCGAGCNNPHVIYVEKGSKIYQFVFDDGVLNHCPIKLDELPSETASQILSTFRFAPTP